MADCEMLGTCAFFRDEMERMPASADWLKTYYCRDRFIECARLLVARAQGRECVPRDLFPHQEERARTLIAASSASPAAPSHGSIAPPPRKPGPDR